MTIISVTERGTFKRCRQQWDYSAFSRQGLAPIIAKPALQLGTLIHAAQAHWIEHPEQEPAQIFAYFAQQELTRIRNHYKHVIGMTPSDDELDKTYENIALGSAMMTNYKKHWKSPLPEGFRAIAPEQTVMVPIPGTPHMLEATLDTLLQHVGTEKVKGTNMIYVHERKTFGKHPDVESLNMSDQFLGYIYVVTKLGIGEVGGIAYDGMWKRPGPPRGRTFDELFLRVLLSREPSELERFERDLIAEANDMTNPDVPIYLNRRWEGCYDCDFARLCVSDMRDEDSNYVRKEYYTKRQQTKPSYDEPPVKELVLP